jgi:hypothetical protein
MVDSCLSRHLDVQLHAARAQIASLSARDGIELTSTPVNLGFRCTCRCCHLNNNGAPGWQVVQRGMEKFVAFAAGGCAREDLADL